MRIKFTAYSTVYTAKTTPCPCKFSAFLQDTVFLLANLPSLFAGTVASADDISRLLNLGSTDSCALADVITDYFGDYEDSEDQESSEDHEESDPDPDQGKRLYKYHNTSDFTYIHIITDNTPALAEDNVDTEGKLQYTANNRRHEMNHNYLFLSPEELSNSVFAVRAHNRPVEEKSEVSE